MQTLNVKGATTSSAWFWADTKLCWDISQLFKDYFVKIDLQNCTFTCT